MVPIPNSSPLGSKSLLNTKNKGPLPVVFSDHIMEFDTGDQLFLKLSLISQHHFLQVLLQFCGLSYPSVLISLGSFAHFFTLDLPRTLCLSILSSLHTFPEETNIYSTAAIKQDESLYAIQSRFIDGETSSERLRNLPHHSATVSVTGPGIQTQI